MDKEGKFIDETERVFSTSDNKPFLSIENASMRNT